MNSKTAIDVVAYGAGIVFALYVAAIFTRSGRPWRVTAATCFLYAVEALQALRVIVGRVLDFATRYAGAVVLRHSGDLAVKLTTAVLAHDAQTVHDLYHAQRFYGVRSALIDQVHALPGGPAVWRESTVIFLHGRARSDADGEHVR